MNNESVMSQWIKSIIDKWIFSKREHDHDKYWKITSYYMIAANDRLYKPTTMIQNTKSVFEGYTLKTWEDDESSFFKVAQQEISFFDFNKYRILDDDETNHLDVKLVKALLENKVSELIKDYNFDEYF